MNFNEAGAECPGKPQPDQAINMAVITSMRPGLNAPENEPEVGIAYRLGLLQ